MKPKSVAFPPSRTSTWFSGLFVTMFIGVPLIIAASAGVFLARARPGLGPVLGIVTGLIILASGLHALFRLGAFGSALRNRNRIKESAVGCAMVLLGVGQLAANPYVSGVVMLAALALVAAAATGRPTRLFAASGQDRDARG